MFFNAMCPTTRIIFIHREVFLGQFIIYYTPMTFHRYTILKWPHLHILFYYPTIKERTANLQNRNISIHIWCKQ